MSAASLADNNAAETGGLTGWIVNLMETLGGPGVGIAVGLDNLFPPIPSELVLPLAGFTASQGTFTLPGALLWSTVGSVLGAVLVYVIGAVLGHDRSRAIIAKLPLMKAADFDKTGAWFDRHGPKAVFFGRMVPLFRSFISLPAGVARMNFSLFLLLTTLGSLIWNTVFVVAGYQLGQQWHVIERYAGVFQKIVIVVVAVAIVRFVWTRLRARNRQDAQQPDAQRQPVAQSRSSQ